jgi:hypothetical protein
MSARRLLARAIALSATTVVVGAGLSTTAFAAGSVSVTSGNFASNNGTTPVGLATSDPYPGAVQGHQPPVEPTVKVTRHGTSESYTASPVTVGDGTTTTSLTATFTFANINPGDYDVSVSEANAQTDTCSSCFHVSAFAPKATSVSPDTLGGAATVQPFVISGQNFTIGAADSEGSTTKVYNFCSSATCTGPSVAIYEHGAPTPTPDPNVSLVQTVDSNGNEAATAPTASAIAMRIAVSNSPAIQALRSDDVVVTNSDGKQAVCSSCLSIAPRPAISSVLLKPNNLGQIGENATGQTVVVTGTNLPTDSVVTFHAPSSNCNCGAITYAGATAPTPDGNGHQTITLTGVAAPTAADGGSGTWTAAVSSAALHTASATLPFTVDDPPSPDSASGPDSTADSTTNPATYGAGAQKVHLVVGADAQQLDATEPFVPGSGSGSNFTRIVLPGAPAGFVLDPSQTATSITSGPPQNQTTTDTVTATLSIPEGASASDYPIALVNPDGGNLVCDSALGIGGGTNTCLLSVEAGPALGAANPSTLAAGATQLVAVTGSGFHTGTNAVHVHIGPPNPDAFFDGDVTPTNKTTLPAVSVSVPNGASVGDYPIIITNNDDHGTQTSPTAFHVADLTVTGVSDTGPTNDQAEVLTIFGSQFQPGATVKLGKDGFANIPDIVGTNVNSSQTNQLTGSFDFTNKAPGPYDIVVTNPSGGAHPGTATCPACLNVVTVKPTIDSGGVSPAALGSGASGVTVTVTGGNIYPGATLSFTNAHVHGDPTTAVVTAPNKVTESVSVDPGTAADNAGSVSVVNTDGKSSNASSFTVAPGPTVTSFTPAQMVDGSDQTITVHGTNFATGAVLALSNGVTASNYSVTGTTLTATVHVPAGTVPGGSTAPTPVTVTVRNPDHGSAAAPTALNVDPQPSIAHVSPNSLTAGQTQTVQLIGTNLRPSASVAPDTAAAAAGITVSTVKYISAGEVDATVKVPAAAPTSNSYALALTDTDDQGKANAPFSVIADPSAPTSLSIASASHELDVTWAAPSSDGGSPIQSYTVRVTPHGSSNPVAGTTTADASVTEFDATGLHNGTTYDVQVVANNAAGSGAAAVGSGIPATTPGAPRSVVAKAKDGKVALTWKAPSANGGATVTGYRVDVSRLNKSFQTGGATHYTVGGLKNGKTYTFLVSAHNTHGTGPAARPVTATPKFATKLSEAANHSSVAKGKSVTLSGALTRSNKAGLVGSTVTIWRKVAGGTSYKKWKTVKTGKHGAWHLTLKPAGTASYRVAFAGDGSDRASASRPHKVTVS